MVVFSIPEEKAGISVTVEFIPRSSVSIFVAPLKHFTLGISTKANAPPMRILSLMASCILSSWLPFSVHRPQPQSFLYRADVESSLQGPLQMKSYWSNQRSTMTLFALTTEGREI